MATRGNSCGSKMISYRSLRKWLSDFIYVNTLLLSLWSQSLILVHTKFHLNLGHTMFHKGEL